VEPASVDKMAYPLPDKPSVAVLPFTNISDDPKQEYLYDGLTEEIITALSKVRNMFVIARNSTFTYKGKAVKIQQVAEELGVRYVLEGSVQKSQDRLRITAQLIDAVTGHHLWAERYDRKLEDIFTIQDKVTFYAEKAVALAPNDSEVLYEAGRALPLADKPQDAIKYLKISNKLDPLNKAGVYMAFPYFSLKQYKEAVTAFEQGATNVRDEAGILPFASASYAFLGRKEEAKATLDKWIQLVGRISADAIYSTYGMKNIEVFDRFMEGITLAGREGGTKIYTRVDENKKLTGQQIKELMFGRTEFIGAYFIDQFFHRKEDGEVTYQAGDSVDSGISWIENDKLCNKFEKRFGGYNDCFYIYENPIGDSKYKNDYLKVTDYGLVQITLEK
jgi:TolB-like protein